jgi:hypothetical protein
VRAGKQKENRMDFTLGTKLADTVTIELIDAGTDEVLLDSNEMPMTVEVYGSDSKKYRKARARIIKENDEKRSTKKRTADSLVEEITANCIASWNIEIGGEKVPFTPENALKLFEQSRPIYEQVIEAQTDRRLFFQK